MSYCGYDLRVQERLLRKSQLDAISGCYHYTGPTHHVVGPYVPIVPWDHAAAVGKLVMAEDDTRTPFAAPGCSNGGCLTTEQTSAIVRRDLMTSWLHGGGSYFFDMGLEGWWGRNDTAAARGTTSAIWGNISGTPPLANK